VGAHFIAWFFLGVLAFGLAYYEHSEKSFTDATTYRIDARHLALGAPRPWLAWNAVSMSGSPPPLEILPGGSEYTPGVHVDSMRLALAVSSSLVIAFVLFALCLATWPEMARRGDTPSIANMLAIAFTGAIAGAVSPTDPAWIGALLGLALVPASIAAVCWKRTSALPILLGSAVGVACMVWTQRMLPLAWMHAYAAPSGFSKSEFSDVDLPRVDLNEFVVVAALLYTWYAVVVMTVVAVRRVVTRDGARDARPRVLARSSRGTTTFRA
jgi:hypothetical protein